MKRIFRSLAALLIIAISFSAISFAWLAGGKYLNFPSSFGGSAVSAYFAGGDGSEKNPFIIKNSVHLYNLAWLQYLGYFNQREGFNNGRDQTYFALGSNVDMKGRAIPPIGTEQYPFIGNFDGKGFTVKKLTVSNKRGTGDLVYAPTNANFSSKDMLCHVNGDNSEVEIVGMFGVTGNYNGYLDDYLKNHAKNPTEFETAKVSVSNFYVDKIHVRSNSAKTLAGLAAGYIGGNFSNVGVYRGDLNFAANAQSIDDSGVLSQYSLVGAYNEGLITWDDNTTGTGTWGGSIDMRTLARRVNYMMATAENVYYYSSAIATFKNDNYHLYASSQRVKNYIFEYGYNPNGSQSLGTDANLLGGSYKTSSSDNENLYTVLPININKSIMGLDNDDETVEVSRNVYKYTGSFNSG